MKHVQVALLSSLIIALVCVCPLWSGTTGKIAGTVIDKATGEALPGANVIVVETSMGAATDVNGQFTILHVPPGQYDVKVSVIGYAVITVSSTTTQSTSTNAEPSCSLRVVRIQVFIRFRFHYYFQKTLHFLHHLPGLFRK